MTPNTAHDIIQGKFHESFREMTHITELARIVGASVDELRYLERKGFVNPSRVPLKQRVVRQYEGEDIRKVQLIIKYRRQGFTWDMAFSKALRELENPSLFKDG